MRALKVTAGNRLEPTKWFLSLLIAASSSHSCSPVGKSIVDEVLYKELDIKSIVVQSNAKVGESINLTVTYLGAECGPIVANTLVSPHSDNPQIQLIFVSVTYPEGSGPPKACQSEGKVNLTYIASKVGTIRFRGRRSSESNNYITHDVTVTQ